MASPTPKPGDLTLCLVRGEHRAFTQLYDLCAERLYRYAVGRVGPDAAADVVQAVFLRAVKSRQRFAGVENPVAYLFQMVRNEVLRTWAKQPAELRLALAADDVVDPRAEESEDREAIAAAMQRLSGEDREIVELKIYGGLTFAEIAQVLERPANTVATKYRRALESLRGYLARDFYEHQPAARE